MHFPIGPGFGKGPKHLLRLRTNYITLRIDKEYAKGDDKYVSKLMFYDMEGKLVDEVNTKKICYVQLANEKMLMMVSGSQGFAYINTEEIGTGEINIKEFEK